MTMFGSACEIVADFWPIFGLLLHAKRFIEAARPPILSRLSVTVCGTPSSASSSEITPKRQINKQ